MAKNEEKNAVDMEFPFQAEARLILNKAHVSRDPETKKRTIPSVTFSVKEVGGQNLILTPRIDLEGSFFREFLDSGRPENYEVQLLILARRTDFKHEGIPSRVAANNGPVSREGRKAA